LLSHRLSHPPLPVLTCTDNRWYNGTDSNVKITYISHETMSSEQYDKHCDVTFVNERHWMWIEQQCASMTPTEAQIQKNPNLRRLLEVRLQQKPHYGDYRVPSFKSNLLPVITEDRGSRERTESARLRSKLNSNLTEVIPKFNRNPPTAHYCLLRAS
jgi:hypothetical protein